MLKKLVLLCFFISFQGVMADSSYHYNSQYRYNIIIDPNTNQATNILVQYSDPSNPCWAYLYWINSKSSDQKNPVVNLPLPGQDYRTIYVPNESMRKMNESILIQNAISGFNSFISSGRYALSKDPDLASLATLSPKPSSLSFAQVLLYNDPRLRVTLDGLKLIDLGLSPEDIALFESRNLLSRSRIAANDRSLGEFIRFNVRRLNWTSISSDQSANGQHIKKIVLDLLSRGHEELSKSESRMMASWTEQRDQLSENKP